MFCAALIVLGGALIISPETVKGAFSGREGALVVLNKTGQAIIRYDEAACAEKLPPCSTFKIWNSAIGLETGIVSDPDAPFWKWDGQKRWLGDWNRDQTLRSAFAASCVPAYQALARKIGRERMAEYIHKLSYGDEDISAGVDVFWLPAPRRKPLLISPDEQAALLAKLASGKLAFSPGTQRILKDIMKAKQTEQGTLYGKTGTGQVEPDN
ncbi:MAG TPA: penicillin-binding transpeptidase domain-containing protein [Terrimicrobiaceae bacterium]